MVGDQADLKNRAGVLYPIHFPSANWGQLGQLSWGSRGS